MPIRQTIPMMSEEYIQEPLIKETGFREYDLRWLVGKEFNEQGSTLLGRAFGTMIQSEYGLKDVVLGQDYREYSSRIKNAFMLGVVSTGMNIHDIGLSISPQLYFAQYHLNMKAGAMITASHNDNGWSGFKLAYDFSRTFGPEHIQMLKKIVYREDFLSGSGTYQQVPEMRAHYIQDLEKYVNKKKPLKLVVCTGNGSAGLYTPETLRRAGHEVIEHLTELNWDFPNFNPNPENIKFLESIGRRVVEEKADLGIGIDGDGDRLGVVDSSGEEIFSDKVGLLIAIHLSKTQMNAKFVIDVKSTALFNKIIVDKGMGEVIHWKTGHSYIKEKVLDEQATAGFERSGHFFFNQPLGRGYDDANLSALMLCNFLSYQDIPISEILGGLPKTYQSPNMQPRCADTEKYKVVERVQDAYKELFESNTPVNGLKINDVMTVNGVRVRFEDESWFLVRASSNVPALVVLGETFTSQERLAQMMKEVVDRLKTYPEIGEFDQLMDFSSVKE
jgi:phosphomannomutase/phosphoglucomutase